MASGTVHAIADEALGNTSYLIETGDGAAIAVDPRRDAGKLIALASNARLRIAAVLETHLHADFVSGSLEIAHATGAAVHAAAEAGLAFPHVPVSPGERITIGGAAVEVLATPGHTPEHIAFLVTMEGTSAVFSGGSLIVGGAARTDLSGHNRTEQLARAQHDSLRRLAALPDDTGLYPTHGAGSFCSTGPGRSATSTIGAERATNPLLQAGDEDAFVEQLLASFGSYPRYFTHLREVNRTGPPLLASLPGVPRLEAAAAQAAVERGAWLIDGRAVQDWARAHPAGAVSVAVRPSFASWLGWVVPFGAPVVLMLDPEQLPDALRLARRIGYDRVEGWLRFETWRAAGLPVSSTEQLAVEQVADRAAAGALLLDVRQEHEFATAHLPGAVHLELGDVIAGKSPEAAEVIAYCGHGERSATAASLLRRRDLRVATVQGGTSAWRGAGYPFAS